MQKFQPSKVKNGRIQFVFSTCRDGAAHICTDASLAAKVLMQLKSRTSKVVRCMGGRNLCFPQEKDVWFVDLEEMMINIKLRR